MKSRKRVYKKIILVNRDFQLRYTKAAILVGVVSTFLSSIVILYPLYQFEILRIPKFLPAPILFAMFTAVCINITLIAVSGIFMTHRIAGPMYSLMKALRKVGQGKFFGEMGLRENDEFKFIARHFNDMLASLQHLTKDDLQKLESISQNLEDVSDHSKIKIAFEQLLEVKRQMHLRLNSKNN